MQQSNITGEKISTIPLKLPKIKLETRGLWLEFSTKGIEDLGIEKDNAFNAIHAITHLLLGLFPLHVLCDRGDIDGFPKEESERLRLFLFDNYDGSMGLCERGFEYIESLLQESLKTVKTCKCERGCPSCIHMHTCNLRNDQLDKENAINILEYMLNR